LGRWVRGRLTETVRAGDCTPTRSRRCWPSSPVKESRPSVASLSLSLQIWASWCRLAPRTAIGTWALARFAWSLPWLTPTLDWVSRST